MFLVDSVLKANPWTYKTLSNAVDNEVVKKTKFNTLNAKVEKNR